MSRIIPILGEAVAILAVVKVAIWLGVQLGLDTAPGWFLLGYATFVPTFVVGQFAKTALRDLVAKLKEGKSA